jgi:endonuclease/exonuclease/phosphatase family metal-dependent hydrolase
MATTLETDMDNDRSNTSNGVMGSSWPTDTRNNLTLSTPATHMDNGSITTTMENETILQWNMNGFWNKYENLKILMEKWTPKVICLQETHLKPNKNPNIKGYTGYYDSKDANHAQHGTCILVQNDVKSEEIFVMTDLNATAAKISLEVETTVCSLYIPPSDINTKNKSKRVAAKMKDIIEQLPKPYLIVGDFNAYSMRWGSTRESSFGKELTEVIDNTDTIILNTGEKTHFSLAYGSESAFDLTLTTADLAPKFDWFVYEDLHGSDHFPIIIQSVKTTTRLTKRPRWILTTANWTKYKHDVKNYLEKNNNKNDIITITSAIIESAKNNIKITKETIQNRPLKWMNDDLRKLIRERRKAERKLKRPHTTTDIINYKRPQAKVRFELKKSSEKGMGRFHSYNYKPNAD